MKLCEYPNHTILVVDSGVSFLEKFINGDLKINFNLVQRNN